MNSATVGTSALGLALLIIGGVLYWKKKSLKLITWMWLAASFTLTGSLIASLREVLQQAAAGAGGWFSVTANVILGVAGVTMLVIVWLEAPLKKGKGRRGSTAGAPAAAGGRAAAGYTPFLALTAPILLGAVTGGTLSSWYANIAGFIGKAGGPIGTFFGA